MEEKDHMWVFDRIVVTNGGLLFEAVERYVECLNRSERRFGVLPLIFERM